MASKRSPVEELDQLDRRILSALSENGRLTTSALAEQVGLSTSPCWTRVKRLEETGAIEKYVAVLNHGNLGYNNVAFVEITLDKHDDKALERFGGALARIPEVMEAYLVTGDYDYLIKVVVRDTDHYERFLRQALYRIPGIRQSRTTFGLRTLKRQISIDPVKASLP
ncbi:Lrp/AsnC family transcriptional regulator [Bradyrhizobium liaoningense]|uniref:Lrp/AsnC family transcriptional regulator n=1 Tax=Bradyrhizobium liaoningense TaxID=43992 RepID=UPI001BA76B8D|nr:Lrp/AsnC family transcriptional regulator [Bradyrhizobium liaoningense]MBR0906488.1 Lrp/AsnC family transcriptional regulator [Bradyrhizobium liaoningense]